MKGAAIERVERLAAKSLSQKGSLRRFTTRHPEVAGLSAKFPARDQDLGAAPRAGAECGPGDARVYVLSVRS